MLSAVLSVRRWLDRHLPFVLIYAALVALFGMSLFGWPLRYVVMALLFSVAINVADVVAGLRAFARDLTAPSGRSS